LDQNIVCVSETPIFSRKLAKIAENCVKALTPVKKEQQNKHILCRQMFVLMLEKSGVICTTCYNTEMGPRQVHWYYWVRIQKPIVTYDLGKFSVTNCARLPNYFERHFLNIFYTFLKLVLNSFFSIKYCIIYFKINISNV
jgi:hypothetical protein